jgi:phosphate transport system ATP-binding protein
MANLAEEALKQVLLWKEVKDRLKEDATTLFGGQQQRLCIARALVSKPQILMLDEPASSQDAHSAQVMEELTLFLKQVCTIVMVSHYMDQVRRIADTIMENEDGMLIQRL